jgi:hypothetical protein
VAAQTDHCHPTGEESPDDAPVFVLASKTFRAVPCCASAVVLLALALDLLLMRMAIALAKEHTLTLVDVARGGGVATVAIFVLVVSFIVAFWTGAIGPHLDKF